MTKLAEVIKRLSTSELARMLLFTWAFHHPALPKMHCCLHLHIQYTPVQVLLELCMPCIDLAVWPRKQAHMAGMLCHM